jgi:RNA polymerase sigma-70 factor (ECF subfamily)
LVSDEVLIQCFRNGDEVAFVNLYNRYKKAVYVFSIKMLRDKDDAKDIVQGVFLKLYEHVNQLMHPEDFKSWLFAIARNDCLTYLRKANRSSDLPDEMEDFKSELPHEGAIRDDEIRLINTAIDKLKPDLKEVIVLREYDNLSYREIAEVIGATENIVKSRLFTARQRLYDMLKPVFVERD